MLLFINKITCTYYQLEPQSDSGSDPGRHCKLRKALNAAAYAQFWPPLHQNAFGGRALSGPTRGAYSAPQAPLLDLRDGQGEDKDRQGKRSGKGEGWVRERAGVEGGTGRGEGKGQRHGKG